VPSIYIAYDVNICSGRKRKREKGRREKEEEE
jgi:hypothetical protein